MQNEEVSTRRLKLLVAILCLLIAAFHIGFALTGKSIRRDSHLGTALEYGKGPIDLLRPTMVGFNATGTPTAQEFPVWQAAAGLAFKITHSAWYGLANIVSLLLFATALWPFFQLARHYVGERAAWWSLAFFLAEPLIILTSGQAATDGFCLAAILWFLFCADRMIRSGKIAWWLPTAFFAALSAVSKLPFFMTAGFTSIFILWLADVRNWKSWMLLASAGLCATAVFLVWTHYTDSLSVRAVYPFVDLRVNQNPWLKNWFFGDMHFRLSPGPWIKGGWRFLHGTLGSLPVAAVFVLALLYPGNRLPKLWLMGGILTTLVFTHLVLAHWHYYLPFCPAVALLCGATLARWEPIWAERTSHPTLAFLLAGIMLIFSAADGLNAMKIPLDYDPFPQEMAQVLREHTKPTDKLIMFDSSVRWGGEELFASDRNGFYVYDVENVQGGCSSKGLRDLLNSDTDLARLKSLGYNRLVLLSESPTQFAAQALNPGMKRRRFIYPAHISPRVDAWPVFYQTEDILIKEIP
jgi:hypothetical protein